MWNFIVNTGTLWKLDVVCSINLLYFPKFLRDTPPQIKARTAEAKKTLQLWKDSYREVRAKIEESGRDARWEFDRKRLFEKTDYMATICQDIYDVAQVSFSFTK